MLEVNSTTKFTLINFATHVNSSINLDPIVSITGEGDSGKTHLSLGLRILLFAEPFPIDLIRDFEIQAELRLDFICGSYIKRTRTKDSQKYEFSIYNENTKTFIKTVLTGVKGVENKLSEITGFNKVVLDNTVKDKININFLEVDADEGLLGRSDTIQRKVMTLTGAGDLELVKYIYNKELQEANSKKKTLTEGISKLTTELSEFNQFESSILGVTQQIDNINAQIDKIQTAKDSLSKIQHELQQLQNTKHSNLITSEIDKVILLLTYLEENKPKLENLNSLLQKLKSFNNDLITIQQFQLLKSKELLDIKKLISSKLLLLQNLKCKTCGNISGISNSDLNDIENNYD